MSRVTSLLRNYLNISFVQVRSYIKKPVVYPGGIKYFGFTYYPRHPDFKDPPYEPTKLFLIKRLVKMKGLNPVEKSLLQILNINGQKKYNKHIAIVKNIPEVNCKLWKIKHLISIVPIHCKYGLPKDNDFTGTYLRHTGEFIVSDKLKVDPQLIQKSEALKEKVHNHQYLTEYLRKKWDIGLDCDI